MEPFKSMTLNSFSKRNNFEEVYEPTMFWNFALDKGRLKNFVCWFLKTYGEKKTLEFLEQLKILGFGYATRAGISLGIEDLKIPPSKAKLLAEAELALAESALSYRRGEITGIEKMQRFIETWNETSESLKQEVVRYFEKTDILNPVYMMAFSGARGNLSQVRQLVGMRGLMSDPQGKIIDFPIQSNFREGLTLTEYLISTYGARKGIVDTALRTATAGYLTRRLVDVAQHVIVSKFDCGTQRGIFLFDMKEGPKTIYSFQTRLTGRVLAQDILQPSNLKTNFNQNPSYIAYRNQEITSELAELISKATKKALVRSPLTCETRKLVCQLCYGWSLATSRLVSIGETVGVIAGQSIGEPGTQLTMRTFHTGGVFSANVTQQINAPFSGIVEYAHPIAGTCIRLPNGTLGFLTKTSGTMFLKKYETNDLTSLKTLRLNLEPILTNTYKIPAFTILFARHGQLLEINSIVAQISALPTGQKLTQTIEQTIYSSLEGEVYFSNIDVLEDIDEKYGERVSKAEDWAKVWVLAAKISKNNFISPFFSKLGDYVSKSSIVNEIQWVNPNPQPSFFNLKIQPQAKLKMHEYSLNLKNQISRFSDFKLNSAALSTSLKETNVSLLLNTKAGNNLRVVLNEKLPQKPTVHISSKYQINKKLLKSQNFQTSVVVDNQSLNLKPKTVTNLHLIDLLKNKENSLLTRYKTNNGNKSLLKIDTEFNYPFHVSSRFSLSKVLKQTFVSLPVLRPGSLTSWLKIQKNQYQKKANSRHMKFTEQKGLHLFVKKLNMNPRFRSYEVTKANFFQPFILGTLVPFTLKQKTIQNWLRYQLKQNLRESQISNVVEFEKQKLSNPLLLNYNSSVLLSETFPDQNLYKHLTFKHKKKNASLTKTKNNVSKNFSKKDFFNLRKYTHFSSSVFSSHKFQQLAMQTPMLTLPTKNIQYQKLGYFASIPLDSSQTDQFFSALPLQLDGTIPSGLQSLVQQNAKGTNFKNFNQHIQYSQHLNQKNLENLKNSYQWGPYSSSGFHWLPNAYSIPTNGLFLIYSPSRLEKMVQQFLFKFTSKLFKTSAFDNEKYANFLNFAQSQSFKKLMDGKNSFDLTKKAILKQINFVFSDQKQQNANRSNKKGHEYYTKNKIKFSSFNKNSHTYLLKKLIQQTPETIKLCHKSELLNFKKSFLNPLNSKSSEEVKKFNEVKLSLFGKKDTDILKSKKQFLVKLNLNDKTSVFFDEIYWLPQENYTLTCYNFKDFSKNLQDYKFSFIKKQRMNVFSNTKLNFYLTNAQGSKKEFSFKNEGLLKLTKLKQLKIASIKQQAFNTKKYPSFLNQNVIFQTNGNSREFLNQNNQENRLKLNFLNYLQSSKFLQKKVKNKKKTNWPLLKKLTKHENFIANKSMNSLFNFVPFLQKNNLKMDAKILGEAKRKKMDGLNQQSEKLFRSSQMLNSKGLSLTLKPGWIYKTNNISDIFHCHKSIIDKGEIVLDDISFEQQKVFIEIIPPFLSKSNVRENLKTKKRFVYKLKSSDKTNAIFVNSLNETNLSQNVDSLELSDACGNNQLKYKKNPLDKDFQIFEISRIIENPNSRFFKNSNKEKSKSMQKPEKTKQKLEQMTFSILIRPFYHKILPSSLHMKTKLYSSMKKSEKMQFETSYSLYKQYFLSSLNCQINPGKTVSSFPPMDLKLEKVDNFPMTDFLESQLQKSFSSRLFTKDTSKSKQYSKFHSQKRTLFSWKFYLEFLLKDSKYKMLPEKQQKKLYSFVLGTRYLKISKNTNGLKNKLSKLFDKSLYISNYPIQLSSYKVSVESAFENCLNPKLPKISLKLTTFENSLFTDFSTTKITNAIGLKYLNLLLLRSNNTSFLVKSSKESFLKPNSDYMSNASNNGVVSKKVIKNVERKIFNFNIVSTKSVECSTIEKNEKNEKTKNSVFPVIYEHRKQAKQKEFFSTIFINSSTIKHFLRSFVHVNFFEFSYEEKYSFFANQRLFASSFYKQQFKNSLRLNVLNTDTISTESVRSKRFIQNYLNKNVFVDSRYELNNSKNQMLFQNQTLVGNKILGLTSFYSPYEGEVLKDYASESDLDTLNKSFNINLDNAHLQQTQGQQLILTKSDLFSLDLSNLKELKKIRKTLLTSKDNFESSNSLQIKDGFFTQKLTKTFFENLIQYHQSFQRLENTYFTELDLNKYEISEFTTQYQNKQYRLKKLNLGMSHKLDKLRLGTLISTGDNLYTNKRVIQSGQIVHLNAEKLTLRKAEFFSVSPKTILHSYNGHSITKNIAVMTLPFETLKTGDIVQGIPKVEQYLEARTTIQGRLFLNSLPVLLYAIYQRYASKLNMEKAVRQSFLKIQQILVDGIQRVYRSQGVGIADKHLEIIVRQMTSKVKIVHGGQTGFFAGEIVDLEFVERINSYLMVKIRYEPIVLGITRASLEVDSFLSAASFQQTTKVLTRAAIENKKDFLKGLKENLLVGNLLPAGTGYVLPKVH